MYRTKFITKNHILVILAYILATAFTMVNAHAHPADSTSATILTYYRIGQGYAFEESLDTDQFLAQMQDIKKRNLTVLPLPEIIKAYQNNTALPRGSIAITFEGGYRSILSTAIPYLNANNIPFTIFYAAQNAENMGDQYLSWAELQTLRENPLATIGVLPYSYSELAGKSKTDIQTELNLTKIAYREHFAAEPLYFSYPYGEYDANLRDLVKEHGYEAAVGLQSGAAYAGSDLFALPRFSVTEKYGDLDHFATILNALPLPAQNIEPQDTYLRDGNPVIGFTLDANLQANIDDIACFVGGAQKADIEKVGDLRVEIRLTAPVNQARTRINCTLPVDKNPDEEGGEQKWRWLGYLLTLGDSEPVQDDSETNTSQTGVLP